MRMRRFVLGLRVATGRGKKAWIGKVGGWGL
jgi:hypothetical protein